MSYLFTSVLADGDIDWKRSLTAKGQPGIAQLFVVVTDDDLNLLGEWTELSSSVLRYYSEAVASGSICVGHSVQYVYGHLRAEMIQRGTDPYDGRVKTLCTMLGLAGMFPKRNGRLGWPTFDESCDHFGITRAGTETAEDNARCLVQVFKGMERLRDGILPEVTIWKERTQK